MKLRDKLFLYIGLLFLVTAAGIYLIPKFLIESDVSELQNAFSTQIDIQRKEDFELRKRIFNQTLQDDFKGLNATLYSIYEEGDLINLLSQNNADDNFTLWDKLGELVFKNPEVNFLQINDQEHLLSGLAVDSTIYNALLAHTLTNNIMICMLQQEQINKGKTIGYGPFIGIRFPLDYSTENLKPLLHEPFSYFVADKKPSVFFLYPLNDILNLSDKRMDERKVIETLLKYENIQQVDQDLFDELTKIAEEKEAYFIKNSIKTPLDMAKWFRSKNVVSSGVEKIDFEFTDLPSTKVILDKIKDPRVLLDLSRMYLYHLLSGIKMSPFEKGAPVGAATFYNPLDEKGFFEGGGFLNFDIFFSKPLFDSEKFFEKINKIKNLPISKQAGLIHSPFLELYFFGSTLNISSNEGRQFFVTLGKSLLASVLNAFSLQNEWMAFIDEKGEFVFAVDGSGEFLKKDITKIFPVKDMAKHQMGRFTSADESYYYFQLTNDNLLPLHIAIIVPEKKQPIYAFFKDISKKIDSSYSKFTLQMLEVILAVFGIALLLLAFISKKITEPLGILKNATEKISKGYYSEVVLPDITSSKDEVSALTLGFKSMIEDLKDKERIRALLNKVVSKEIADEVLKGNVSTHGQMLRATVLFADIRGFTKMTEHANPQFLLKFLNVYMDAMSKIIESYGGIIDKYVGDEIMALYGAPLQEPHSSKRAINSAIEMLKKLNIINNEFQEQGFPEIKIGIGINFGEMVAGNLGAEDRLNYTVLGANVNLAARLCQKAGPMQILVTQSVLDESGIEDDLDFVEIEAEQYKGFSDPVKTFSIFGFKNYIK
jgi:class 3 adenylate cyclase